MRKLAIVVAFLLILTQIVSADTIPNASSNITINAAEIEDKINSIVHYAEEYEVGNINYLQLNVYGFKIRSDLNLMLGGGIGNEWARIPKESIEKAFGQPTEYMSWIWIDNKHMEKRLDEAMPRWEKIIFDGRKVRIILNAFPSAIELENGELFKYYSVDFNVRFKKEFNFNLKSMLDEIVSLTTEYNLTRTRKSGEALVKKMLEAESLFGSYIQENLEQCTVILEEFFKPEEKWLPEKIITWRFSLFNGSNFDVLTAVDFCEECEWHHVYMEFWAEGRGPVQVFKSPELQFGKLEHQIDEEYYWTLSVDEINQELKKAIFEIRDEAEKFEKTRSEDFAKKFFFNRFKIQQINRILDGKYNGVEEFDESIARRIASGELQGPGGCKNLEECRNYCRKQENIEGCRDFTYRLRVDAVEKMLSGYEIEKIRLDRIYWDRWLFENSEIRQDSWCRYVNDIQCKDDEGCADGKCVLALGGNETCNNRVDDDGDNVVDCQDPDCWQERQCGKLCENVCNREGGCWQTSHDLCYSSCKECWDCGGSEECRILCEPACWPCHNQKEIKDACDDCWTCEDEAYGGCYVDCKSCDQCNTQRREKIEAIFDRAAAGEITMPGNCMTEDDCNRYCAGHAEECGKIMNEIGFYSEELDCNEECKECTLCNYDIGDFKCNENQHFDRNNVYCVCDKGWYDCDGDWKNGCETTRPCDAGPCFEECKECDACEGECNATCVKCYKCRNPETPTYLCDGVEQLEPCETEYICNGVKQKKPCEIYMCNGREYTKPCDEINITCGKSQMLIGNECVCNEGFRDCDNDGNCESTKFCGLEICDDSKDNNDDGLIDCQDQKCDRQFCRSENGKELFCIEKQCLDPDEIVTEEPKTLCGNHICENGEKEVCPEDCTVCEIYEPPECPNGKIIWKGKDQFGCNLPPICVVTEKACEADEECPQPKCGVSKCIESECKVTELITECEEGCKEGKNKKRECKDGSEIITAICSSNQWLETGNDCSEVPKKCEEGETNSKKCEDASEIVIKECINGEWIETDKKCPEVVPEEEPETPEIEEEEIPETPSEEIAPEIEEEVPEASDRCVLATDCGGSQDVCSNGNCVTLPITPEKAEEKEKKEEKIEEPEEKPEKTESVVETPSEQQEIPAEEPSQPETPSEQSESPQEEVSPTGSVIADFANSLTGLITGFLAEEYPCKDECSPCDECNQQVDQFMKKIQSGEIQGPNNCKTRMECEEYCNREEHKQECEDFYAVNSLQTFNCWQEICRECDKCKFKIGELQCKANQNFNMDEGYCMCNEGWYDCDGDWENGCEASKRCEGCESKADCAEDRCAPWGNVIQQFDCFKGEEWMQVNGVVRLEGGCRFFPTKKIEGWVGFDMWGEPFENLYPIKEEVKLEMGEPWCEWELENLIKERIEIQNSFTEDSLKWFFEEYIPSSPSEWEKHIGGIYDSYWRIVNNNEWTTQRLLCLGRDKLPEEYKPIDVSYNTEFGSVRIWEVETTTDFFGKRTKILSPYMQIWVFPTKDFIKKEFQEAMESGLMPGPEGDEKPELSPSEIEEAKKDKELMKMVNSLSSKYGGEAKFLLNIADENETVFNALITVNPDIIFKLEPMKEYTGDYDAKIIIDFNFFYALIQTTEKDMRGGQTEYPPWESGFKIDDAVKGVVDGIKMWFMITSASVSGQIKAEPSEALSDGLGLMKIIFERGPA